MGQPRYGTLGKGAPSGHCGAGLDRDWNAATSLLMLAAMSAESQDACGRGVRLRLASASESATMDEAGTHRIRNASVPS